MKESRAWQCGLVFMLASFR